MQQLLLPILMFGALYFLMLRPQKKRAEAQRQLLNNLKEGTEVMTTSGIYGFITAVDGDIVWLEIAQGVDVRVMKAAISRVIDTPASAADAPAIGDGTTDTATTATTTPMTDTDTTSSTIDLSKNDSGGTSGDN
jgi:preprotein translocase subunit YajC